MKNNLTGEVSIIIDAPASKVWDALTNPELIKQYFFNTNAISDWKEGSPIRFKGEYEGKSYEDKGTILEVEPNKIFKYNYWSSMSGLEDRPENYMVITYELFEEGGITTITIEQENIPDQQRKVHSEQSWRMVMNGMKKLLEEAESDVVG